MAGAATRDHRYDVVVLGTGAAGLTAAVRAAADGARVGLFERGEQVGGTSAWSGGVAWLPNNRHEAEAGFADSRGEVLTYLESLSHGLIERPMIEAFADTAPEVVNWLEAHTPVQFETLAGMSDYHPEHPGGRREGRSVECPLFPFEELAEWAGRVTVGWQLTGEFCMSESSLGRKAPNGLAPEELERRKIRDERGSGQALIGRLLKGCLDREVVPQTGCRGVRLLTEDGAVAGVAVEGPDGPFEARAGGGVVLATGGFEHDAKLVRTFLRGPLARAVSVPTNTGDALRMAMRVGADLADMREAWWVATIDVEVPGRGLVPWQVNSERTRPDSIGGLAGQMGVPAGALQDTVQRWNAHAAAGTDPDFHRGESHHDRAWGDPAFGYTPQATIGPLEVPPYYATRVRCGALGTKGGPRTDVSGRVLDVDGEVIGGLYAAGNAMGSIMGMTYGGHGGTLGPGLVFGYLAGQHAAARAAACGNGSSQ